MGYMKNTFIIGAILLLIIAGGAYFYYFTKDTMEEVVVTQPIPTTPTTPIATTASPTPVATSSEVARGPQSIIGTSSGGEPITAYHFGTGDREVVLIGGIHGGYSWNTALLGYELIDWLEKTPRAIPEDITVTIVPVLNPDGLKLITKTAGRFTAASIKATPDLRVKARFNANTVDINRNFDCEWKAAGTWQNQTVSGGATAFSEPESQAIKAYVERYEPTAVVTWYSAAGGVYASNCKNGILAETATMTEIFAKASGYTAHESFDYYEITGDMVNWLAKVKIPAISVLLTNHEGTELAKNKLGVEAILKHFSE